MSDHEHHEDPHIDGLQPEHLIIDEVAQFFEAQRGEGKSRLSQKIIDALRAGRKVTMFDPKSDFEPQAGSVEELSARLAAKRAEIERQLPGFYESYYDLPRRPAVQLFPAGMGKSDALAMLFADTSRNNLLRVGDVVRIIDTQGHAQPIQGHVVDESPAFYTVASVLGRRELFGKMGGWHLFTGRVLRWRLEPYAPPEETDG